MDAITIVRALPLYIVYPPTQQQKKREKRHRHNEATQTCWQSWFPYELQKKRKKKQYENLEPSVKQYRFIICHWLPVAPP